MTPRELPRLRDWNAATHALADGRLRTSFDVGWKHYLGADGAWEPIDTTVRRKGGGFEVAAAPFLFRAPAFADEEAYFEANNRYDVFRKEVIADAPHGMWVRAGGAAHVAGVPHDMGSGRQDAVLYENAFPQWGADLIYHVEHGRAPRLRKLIRFRSDPGGEPRVPFYVRFSGPTVTRHEPDAPGPAALARRAGHLARMRLEHARGTRRGEIAGNAAFLAACEAARETWDGRGTVSTRKGLALRPAGAVSSMRGIGVKDPVVWDSAGRAQPITLEYAPAPGGAVVTKIVPPAFLRAAEYPVHADLTLTVNPDANPETTTMDGNMWNLNGSWATCRGAATAFSVQDSSPQQFFGDDWNGGSYIISRSVYLFDTSALGSGVTVSAAAYGDVLDNSTFNNTDGDSIHIVSSAPASNTTLVVEDFNKLGSTSYGSKTHASYVNDNTTYNDISLTPSCVNLTGLTKLGKRGGRDMSNTAPTGMNRLSAFSFAENGASRKPRLVITYAASGPTTVTTTHAGDALLLASGAKTHGTDADLKGSRTAAHGTDAALKATATKTHGADALLKAARTRPHASDALLKAAGAKTHGTDAALKATAVKTHASDSLLNAAAVKTHAADALLQAARTRTTASDALLLKRGLAPHASDALLRATRSPAHASDALLKAALTRPHASDTLLRAAFAAAHASNAFLIRSGTASHGADAFLTDGAVAVTAAHGTDALLTPEPRLLTIQEALFRELKYGPALNGLVPQANVRLDARPEASTGGPVPWAVFRRVTSSEGAAVNHARERWEIELIGAFGADALLQQAQDAVMDRFAGKHRTWGEFTAAGYPAPGTGLRMRCRHVSTVELAANDLSEKAHVLIFRFTYVRAV